MRQKLTLLFTLYFCQGLPGGFLAVALPVILRERGFSLQTVGFSAFLSAPWILKIIWAPLVDKFSWKRFGRRKSWIIPAHLGMLAVTMSLAFFTPDKSLFTIALLFLALNFFAATQDIGVDGLAVDILKEDEMGPGNTAQISGFKLGNLFGGGVLLALSGVLGWTGDFIIMFGCILVAMMFLLFTNENRLTASVAKTEPIEKSEPIEKREPKPILVTLGSALYRQGLLFWLFLGFAKFGETFGGAMVRPMLVDQGMTRQMIGILDGTIGSVSTIIGGVLGGIICRKWGWRYALACFSAVQGLFLISLGIYSSGSITPLGAGILNAFENMAGGGVGVAVFVLAMSMCAKEVGASQFTISQVIYMGAGYLAYPLSGWSADHFGYLPVMASGGAMALMVTLAALRIPVKSPAP